MSQRTQADHVVNLGLEQTVDIVLPDGQTINIMLGYQEPGYQHPEIDIALPKTLTANLFAAGLKMAETKGNTADVIQITIPIPIRGCEITGDDPDEDDEIDPPLIGGVNLPIALCEVVDGWNPADVRRAYKDFKAAGGQDTDPDGFDKFLESWSG